MEREPTKRGNEIRGIFSFHVGPRGRRVSVATAAFPCSRFTRARYEYTKQAYSVSVLRLIYQRRKTHVAADGSTLSTFYVYQCADVRWLET
jgi:hypothetical protein